MELERRRGIRTVRCVLRKMDESGSMERFVNPVIGQMIKTREGCALWATREARRYL
jgi:hypothetical protein